MHLDVAMVGDGDEGGSLFRFLDRLELGLRAEIPGEEDGPFMGVQFDNPVPQPHIIGRERSGLLLGHNGPEGPQEDSQGIGLYQIFVSLILSVSQFQLVTGRIEILHVVLL